MAKRWKRTTVLLVVSVCALGVIFIPNTPALQRNHDWKEKRNTTIGCFTASKNAIHTSVSLENDDTSENNASEGTSVSLETVDTSASESTYVSLETNDTSENHASESTSNTSVSLDKSESNGFSKTRPTPVTVASQQGYMLALNYYDQLTAGSINLQSLMCLAKKIGGVQVVEPFVMGSLFGLNVSANWTKEVRMSDIFDFKAWKRTVPFKKYGELVSFKNFLQNAPRKLLMVQYCTRGDFCYPCKHDDIIFKIREFCRLHDFELVGHECFSYENKMMNFSSIESRLYSKYNKSEVVVMFDLYGGIRSHSYDPQSKPYRFFADIKDCERDRVSRIFALQPSWSVLSNADKYIQTYFNSSAYIAVMIRMEKVFIQAKIAGNGDWKAQQSLVKKCFTNVLQRLEVIKKKFGIDHVFVTIDIGHYGSLYFRKKNDALKAIERQTEHFLSAIYGRNMTLGEYEERHISISGMNNPGYISAVQKQIAARGNVLVLVGSDSMYQFSTMKLYNKYNRKKSKRHVFELDTAQCKLKL